jgi:hypothetical protein
MSRLEKPLDRLVEWHKRGVSRNMSSPSDGSSGTPPVDQHDKECTPDHGVEVERYCKEGADHEDRLAEFADAFRVLFVLCETCDANDGAMASEPSRSEFLKTLGQLVVWYKKGPPPGPPRRYEYRDHKAYTEDIVEIDKYNHTGMEIGQMLLKFDKSVVDAMGALFIAHHVTPLMRAGAFELDKSLDNLVEWHRRGVSSLNDGSTSLTDRLCEHEAAVDRYREEGIEHDKNLGEFANAFWTLFRSCDIPDTKDEAVGTQSRPEFLKTLGRLVVWHNNGPPPAPSYSRYDEYYRTLRPGHHDPSDAQYAAELDQAEKLKHTAQVDQYNQIGAGIGRTLVKFDKPVVDAMRGLTVAYRAHFAKKARLAEKAKKEAEAARKEAADRAEAERIARLPELRALQQKRAMERYDAHSAKIAMLRQIGRKDPVV